jgi:hypothetical protein
MPKWPSPVQPLTASQLPLALSSPRLVAIHCWASWNGYDYQLAQQLRETVERFQSTTDFYTMDVEDASNVELIANWSLLNVPAFVIFRDTKQVAAIWMGQETVEQFRNRVEECLGKAADGTPVARRLDIHPGEGIGPIRLGMRPAEVRAILQEPKVYEDWMGGNLNDALLFHGLRLHFSDCDARAPLPDSALNWIVIHQREDAYLFDRPVSEWTKDAVVSELRARGYDVQTPLNGDVEVARQIGMSFDDEGRLIWVEMSSFPPLWRRVLTWLVRSLGLRF